MTRLCRRSIVIGCTLLLAGFATGCNVLAPFYFVAILAGMDPRLPPQFTFPEDAGRVVVIMNATHESQVALGHIDRELNELVARKLHDSFQVEKKMKEIEVLRASTVAKWQDEHDDWRSLEPVEIGRALNADYVIYVEIEEIGLYQDGHSKMLLQGNADMTVKVVKVDEDEGEVVMPLDSFSVQFPRGRPIPIGDMTVPKFRRAFLGRLAEQVVWYFVPHEQMDDFGRDPF